MSAHPPAWDVNPAAPLLALREAASFLNKKTLEFCVDMGIKQMVYHPGYYDRDSFFSLNRAKDHAYQLLDELIALAKPAGITLAFENIGGPAATLFTQEEFIHALDGIDPCAQLLLDVGHANMNGWNIPEDIDRTAGRLCALHQHDNDGTCDAHLPMGQGSIDWSRTFASMRQLPESCVFIMEYQTGTDLEKLAEGRDMLLAALG